MTKAAWQGLVILLLAAVLGLASNQVRSRKLPLMGDWSAGGRLTLGSGEGLLVTVDEAEVLFFAQSAVFVDARSPSQFREGHIPGAHNFDQEHLEQCLADFAAGYPRDTLIVTYCDGESCELSKSVALALLDEGYTNVRVFFNGWSLWQDRMLPVQRGSNQ